MHGFPGIVQIIDGHGLTGIFEPVSVGLRTPFGMSVHGIRSEVM